MDRGGGNSVEFVDSARLVPELRLTRTDGPNEWRGGVRASGVIDFSPFFREKGGAVPGYIYPSFTFLRDRSAVPLFGRRRWGSIFKVRE